MIDRFWQRTLKSTNIPAPGHASLRPEMPHEHDWAEWARRDEHWKWHVEAKLDQLIHQGRQIMSNQAEAGAKLDTALTNIAAVGQNVVDLNVNVQNVSTLVQELKDAANGNVSPEIMAKIDQLVAATGEVVTGTQAVEDKLTAIAPPAAG